MVYRVGCVAHHEKVRLKSERTLRLFLFWPSHAKLRRQAFVDDRLTGCLPCHCRRHMGGLDGSVLDVQFIKGVDSINEVPVPFIIRIKVMPETSIHKDIDYVGKGDKQIKMEFLNQEGEDILGADSLESFFGAVPVVEFDLDAPQLMVIFVPFRQLLPEWMEDSERLRPSHMAIPADHVV